MKKRGGETACNTACRDLGRTSGHWATLGENRGAEKVRHTSVKKQTAYPPL